MSDKQPMEKLGALWAKSSDKGDYMTGEVIVNGQKQPVVVFANRFYQQDIDAGKNPPVWIVYKSTPREGR